MKRATFANLEHDVFKVIDSIPQGGRTFYRVPTLPHAEAAARYARRAAECRGCTAECKFTPGEFTVSALEKNQTLIWCLVITYNVPDAGICFRARAVQIRGKRYIRVSCGKRVSMFAAHDAPGDELSPYLYAAQQAALEWGSRKEFIAWFRDARGTICFTAVDP